MREILFRGKRVDNNEWVYGFIFYDVEKCWEKEIENKYFIKSVNNGNNYEVIPETIGQYTGLSDKYGTKIFEGDIVEWADNKMEIYWGQDIGIGYGFCWRNIKGENHYHESITGFIDEYEVIRNIHDKEVKE